MTRFLLLTICGAIWSFAGPHPADNSKPSTPAIEVQPSPPTSPDLLQAEKKGDGSSALGDASHISVEQHIERNRRITSAYAQLFLESLSDDRPGRFTWLGLAAYASDLVGQNLSRLQAEQAQSSFPMFERGAINALARGNTLVFMRSYWQHDVYLKAGISGIRQKANEGRLKPLELQAWESFHAGSEHDFLVAFSRFEQAEILQPEIFAGPIAQMLGHTFAAEAKSPVPGGTSFCQHQKVNANISDLAQRWDWFLRAVLPEWENRLRDHLPEVIRDMQRFALLGSKQGGSGKVALQQLPAQFPVDSEKPAGNASGTKVSQKAVSLIATEPEGYIKKTAVEKQAFLWNDCVLPTQYETLPPITGNGWKEMLSGVRTGLSLGITFDRTSDFMEQGRKKFVHRFGSVACIKFVPQRETAYTGMFATESRGLIRLSLTAAPEEAGSFIPGAAVKLLVDGNPSQNLVVMHSLDGQGDDRNFFKHALTNVLPPLRSFLIVSVEAAMRVAGFDLRHVVVDALSKIAPDGTVVVQPRAPRQIWLTPTGNHGFTAETEDFRQGLAQIPAGTELYRLEAEDAEGARVSLGSIITTSAFVASKFGDEQLFFQHEAAPQH